MRRTLSQIRAYVVDGALPPEMSGRLRAVAYLARLSFRIVKQWARDKCPQQAAALAYQTSLSLVPIFAIAFATLQVFSPEAGGRLQEFVADQILPHMEDVTEHLEGFASKVKLSAFGGAGLIFTLVTCYSLYSYVEKIFNDIWRVGQRRTIIGKFLTFYLMVTLLPILAGVSLYQSAAAGPWAKWLVPLLIQFLALMLMNKLLPRTQVRWGPALLGAMLTGIALEALKVGFVGYAKRVLLQNYQGVYGSLGLVPLLLLWIYISWLLVLMGAETAHAVQNLRLLEAEDRRRRGEEPINGMVAAQLLAAVAADRQGGGHGLAVESLAQAFGLTPDIIQRIFQRLAARGLVAEVHGDINGFIPGRPADTIPLDEVLTAFRSGDLETAHGATSTTLRQVIDDLESSRKQRISGLSIADLMPDDAPRKA